MMATILIFGKKRPPSPGQKQQITKGFHDLGYSIISDSRFFRNDPELHYIPMINKDGTDKGPKQVIPAYRCAKYGYCVRTMQLTDVCG